MPRSPNATVVQSGHQNRAQQVLSVPCRSLPTTMNAQSPESGVHQSGSQRCSARFRGQIPEIVTFNSEPKLENHVRYVANTPRNRCRPSTRRTSYLSISASNGRNCNFPIFSRLVMDLLSYKYRCFHSTSEKAELCTSYSGVLEPAKKLANFVVHCDDNNQKRSTKRSTGDKFEH